jgi:hypothetical protein
LKGEQFMIQSYIENPVILPSNTSAVTFTTDCIRSRGASCCCWLQHNEGSPIYKILEGGLYEVTFNANVTSATAGPVALSLLMDGLPVPGATVIETVVTPGDYSNVAFTKKIKICCRGDASLSIASIPSVLTGTALPGTATDTVAPILQNANITITRKA